MTEPVSNRWDEGWTLTVNIQPVEMKYVRINKRRIQEIEQEGLHQSNLRSY